LHGKFATSADKQLTPTQKKTTNGHRSCNPIPHPPLPSSINPFIHQSTNPLPPRLAHNHYQVVRQHQLPQGRLDTFVNCLDWPHQRILFVSSGALKQFSALLV